MSLSSSLAELGVTFPVLSLPENAMNASTFTLENLAELIKDREFDNKDHAPLAEEIKVLWFLAIFQSRQSRPWCTQNGAYLFLNGVPSVADNPKRAFTEFVTYCRQWAVECDRTFEEEVLVMIDDTYGAP